MKDWEYKSGCLEPPLAQLIEGELGICPDSRSLTSHHRSLLDPSSGVDLGVFKAAVLEKLWGSDVVIASDDGDLMKLQKKWNRRPSRVVVDNPVCLGVVAFFEVLES